MASRRLSVGVVQGGPSTEAEVSRSSARGVAGALTKAGHAAVRLELDAFLAETLRTGGYEVVFPAVHGAVGEDGSLQGMLEVLGLPYVGSDVVASALAMHKRVARVLFEHAGLPVAPGQAVRRGDARSEAERLLRAMRGPLVVKPSAHGSAIGVHRLPGEPAAADVARALEAVWTLDEFAIVEHFARGREITCGVLDLERPQALPPTEVVSPKDDFYSFEARYAPGRSIHTCPADLPDAVRARVQELAVRAHEALGCRDLSRVDFVVGDEGAGPPQQKGPGREEAITLLELNTLPGMTETSLYPEAAALHGLAMPDLCSALALRAFARGPARRLEALALPR
jgi:D-alanine-D-alanine ligase